MDDSNDCNSLVSIVATQSELDHRFIDDSDCFVGKKIDYLQQIYFYMFTIMVCSEARFCCHRQCLVILVSLNKLALATLGKIWHCCGAKYLPSPTNARD